MKEKRKKLKKIKKETGKRPSEAPTPSPVIHFRQPGQHFL